MLNTYAVAIFNLDDDNGTEDEIEAMLQVLEDTRSEFSDDATELMDLCQNEDDID